MMVLYLVVSRIVRAAGVSPAGSTVEPRPLNALILAYSDRIAI